MDDWRPGADPAALVARAEMLRAIRAFFADQNVLEVDTPALSAAAATDPQVESFHLQPGHNLPERFLHTSPEFPMKRLLAAGSGDIYQVCKVFRQGEQGPRHNPEFTLLEWYRIGFDHQDLMQDVLRFISAVAPHLTEAPPAFLSYRALFDEIASVGIDATLHELERQAVATGLSVPAGLDSVDQWLDWFMVTVVEPAMPRDRLVFVYDYPASQASLARIRIDQQGSVAERFEVYYNGVELGNGFHELADSDEQGRRFADDLSARSDSGLRQVPVDQHLLDALSSGLPDCAGVAIGIDRLLMAALGVATIGDVMPCTYDRA